MKWNFTLIIFLLCGLSLQSSAFEYSWQIDETPEGSESVTVIEPVKAIILDEVVEVPPHSAALQLMRRYSVHLTPDWSNAEAHRLLQTFQSIPQHKNNSYEAEARIPASVWHLTDRHLLNDIEIEHSDDNKIIIISREAFTHATPLIAEIDGVRGRYFSKRLHHAIVRYVTEDGTDRRAIDHILKHRYAVSLHVPDYTELTKNTTQEHAGRFDDFKNEELLAIVSMLEEYPSGMLKTPGLKYLVRRLDGLPHPTHPTAAAVAWTGAGYIEFMEIAFKETGSEALHRLILHEKAHFLWDHLFDEQLRRDWIELGGWYENPNDRDGWSTTKQVEFVSAYAHGMNPNEDMAESISYYIVNPDKLRSRSPAKYEFIQNRVMHGTRYISQIRADLTFQVYNLYPDYVYPGRIVRIDIEVMGAPEEDKQVVFTLQLHSESDLDTAQSAYFRLFSEKGTWADVGLAPIDANGDRISSGHILKGTKIISRYAADGYWGPDAIKLTDANRNERHEAQTDFGWKLYIDNPLADCEPPQFVPGSIRLSLSNATTQRGEPYQIMTAQWMFVEKNEMDHVCASLNDDNPDTYSLFKYGNGSEDGVATVEFPIPNHYQTGIYELNRICMKDVARNPISVYFTHPHHTEGWADDVIILDTPPTTIHITTTNPDSTPPVLDINNITINAIPTKPEAPDGETRVDITFKVKDNISGYDIGSMKLRDPHGVNHGFWHYPPGRGTLYFDGDPTVWEDYDQTIILPVGSIPGTWGLAEMNIRDKAQNHQRYDFTEIVRFEVTDAESQAKYDVNNDGTINILDIVFVAGRIGESDSAADVNGDGEVNILDLVQIANHI